MRPERLRILNDAPAEKGSCIIYWMQASQRVRHNYALSFAAGEANRLNVPLAVVFCVAPYFAGASLRHYRFMMQGVEKTAQEVRDIGAQFVLRYGLPQDIIPEMAENSRMLVMDEGYTDIQKLWRAEIIQRLHKPCVAVDSDVCIPTDALTDKMEYAAYTIRPKVHRLFSEFAEECIIPEVKVKGGIFESENFKPVEDTVSAEEAGSSDIPFTGGTDEALSRLEYFIGNMLDTYADEKNDPSKDAVSKLSPYIHFGQISTADIARQVIDTGADIKHPFMEELVVRRELAVNFVKYCSHYKSITCLPAWAQSTLSAHEADSRPYRYLKDTLENFQTHDKYWNAAQKQMIKTGHMHGYMRMYWGKKVIEWSETPGEALHKLIYLNDKYSLDGRDASGYAGILWCFGLHDRPWKERSIFGKVRYMNDNGLKRKFDIDGYVELIENMA